MAVTFDAQSFLDFTGSSSWTHTPAGRPRMVAVLIVQDGSAADNIQSVTYGGVAMNRVAWAATNSAEPGAAWVYWLNSAATTAQLVQVSVSAGTNAKTGWAVTFVSDKFMTVRSWGMVFAQDASTTFANPTTVLGTRADFNGVVLNAIFSGLADPAAATLAPLSSATALLGSASGGRDFGTSAGKATYNIVSGASQAVGYTSSADDVAMVSAAFDEATPFPGPLVVPTVAGTMVDNLGIPIG